MSQLSEKQLLGLNMMQEFLGEELFSALRAKARDDLPGKVGAEYIAEVCFSSYARPGLEFRDRALMNLGMLVALNRAPELKIHIRAALKNGLSEEQICEACRHAMVYCGVPAGRDALMVAGQVFEEEKQKQKAEGAKLA
ncbi:AhpD-like protein [Aspergillus pseudodeflectus]|uniref:AhpD-like protein n=1 Tax=Aspergillus pseudodeflectus TaxID=176178 RepID=A0ABR4JAM4_9EURO